MVNKDIVRTVFLKPIAAFAVGGKKMPRPLSQLVRRPLCWISCFSSIFVIYSQRLLTPTVIGNWIQAEPTGCATKCGVAAGSGTPGAVTCDSSSCNAGTKPNAKQCPKTEACGTFDTDANRKQRSPPSPPPAPSSYPLLHRSSSNTSTTTQRQFNTRTAFIAVLIV